MKFYGDIELVNGSILDLHIEEVDSLSLSTIDNNRLLSFDGKLYFNNGVGYKLLQFSETDDESPLITTLGPWVNSDLSFNPAIFNALENVSSLTSENSLFDVISQLDSAISNVTQDSLADLQDVVITSPEDGNILVFSSDTLVNLSLQDAIINYGNVTIQSLNDYDTTGVKLNNDLVYWNSTLEKFTNKRCFFRYSSESSQSEYVLTHNLGIQFCFVEVFDKLTNKKIPSDQYEVIYTTANSISVVLDSATVAELVVFSLD